MNRRLTNTVLVLAASALAACGGQIVEFELDAGSVAAPTVASNTPLAGATGIATSTAVTATFSRAMAPATLNTTTFTLKRGTVAIAGAVSFAGTTATFTPTVALTESAEFTATITTGAQDPAGIALESNHVWAFTTLGAAPRVISTTPASAATGVLTTVSVTATFSTPMQASTITTATFKLAQGATPVTGTVTYAGTTATLTTTAALAESTPYSATITTGAKDLAGLALTADFNWTFTTVGAAPTVTSTIPADVAIDVPITTTVAATFSTAMNPATITSTTFKVLQGVTAVAGAVTYSGTTATFTPTSPLSESATYSATVTTGAEDEAGLAMAAAHAWTFTTAGAAPRVLSTIPADASTDIVATTTVSAVFSKTMNAGTIDSTTFKLVQGVTAVAGTVTYAGTTATFTPTNPLIASAQYTATITTGAKDTNGLALAANHAWVFTVAGSAPRVTSTTPLNAAVDVAGATTVKAVFSTAMNAATIDTTSFKLAQGVTPVAGAVTYTGVTATFTPTAVLTQGATYTATVTTAAKDAGGLALAVDFTWTFTVAGTVPQVASTTPVSAATNVATNTNVTATFSIAMTPSTLDATSFKLAQGVTPVTGAVTYSGTTATFVPAAPLLAGVSYTATIAATAKSAGGVALAAPFTWSFSTAGIAPTVTATTPLNAAIGVPLNSTVTATFSTAMTPASIDTVSFTLKNGLVAVAGAVTYVGTTATFTPTVPLLAGVVYSAKLSTACKDLANRPLAADFTWSFTTTAALAPTVISTTPANLAVGVTVNKQPTATFNTAMDAATITNQSFTVKQGLTTIAGVVTYDALTKTATFKPNAPLGLNLEYTATITTTAANLAGTQLATNFVWKFNTSACSQLPIVLGAATPFVVHAGSTVTNTGPTSVTGDLSLSPGSSVTGFPPGTVVGTQHVTDPTAAAVAFDLTVAYNDAAGRTLCPVTKIGNIGGQTLPPGLYKSTGAMEVSGSDVTLDALGDPEAIFIFQIASTLTTTAGRQVILIGGAKSANVFWQVGTAATFATTTAFKGTVMADQAITMNTGATLNGRVLARIGAVNLDSNVIVRPTP